MWRIFSKHREPERGIDYFGSIADVRSLDLIGPYTTSPSGRYTLIWSDADPSGKRGGYRTSGRGRYVLFDGNRVCVQGTLERPNDGHVTDDGTFILSDWLFGDQLACDVFVFASDGTVLFQHRFHANAFSSGIAPAADYAAWQLCNSDSADGGHLCIIDIRSTLIAQFAPPTGWPQSYIFDIPNNRIGLTNNEGTFWYTVAGTLLDAERWEQARIKSGSGYTVLQLAQERLAKCARPLTADYAAPIIELVQLAASRLDTWPRQRAKAERLNGELSEESGDLAAAIRQYETAVSLDPRCGVKRHLAELKKRTTLTSEVDRD